MKIPSPEEVEKSQTEKGGWSSETLANWGIEWPPRKGWRKKLREAWEQEQKSKSMTFRQKYLQSKKVAK